MKDFYSYVFPVLGLTVLYVCDAIFIWVNYFKVKDNTRKPGDIGDLVLIACYNILVLMATWSLLMAMCKNPG